MYSRAAAATIVTFALLGGTVAMGAPVGAAGQSGARPTVRPAGPLAPFYEQRVTWTPCPGTVDSECATVIVPMDYRVPEGVTITLGLLRKTSAIPGAPSLVFNPGGPGGSATDWVDATSSILVNPASPDITSRYNLVGMDPRGVGRSTQLNCVSQEDLDAEKRGLPDDVAQQLAYAADSTLNEVCAKANKGLTSNIGTDSAAKDLDIVRAALGEEKLNFYGASYGSYLGMMYAHTFPDRVGRMILDGINGPLDDMSGLALAQARGTEESLRGWAATCAARGASCPAGPGKSKAQVLAWLRNLLRVVHKQPFQPATGDAINDRDLLEIAITLLAIGQGRGFTDLDAMLASAATALGNGTDAQDAADAVNSYRQDYGQPNANFSSVNQAVNCYDRPTSGTRATTAKYHHAWRKLAPFFGQMFAPIPASCFHWPVRRTKGLLRVTPTTKTPVLLINGLHDPRTPVRMARQSVRLFPNAGLLLWNGFGHVSGTRGNECINDAVATYLINGTLPPKGITCGS